MYFRARHGCLESELRDGGDFFVDFSADWDISRAAESDCLGDTLDYSRVYEIVAGCMEPPCKLLEALIARIAAALEQDFPDLEHYTLKVSKKNPPVGGECEWASVTLEK